MGWEWLTDSLIDWLTGPNKHQSAVTCLQFNSRFVVTSSDDGTVKLWDVKTGDFIRNLVALDSGGSGGVVWRIRYVVLGLSLSISIYSRLTFSGPMTQNWFALWALAMAPRRPNWWFSILMWRARVWSVHRIWRRCRIRDCTCSSISV